MVAATLALALAACGGDDDGPDGGGTVTASGTLNGAPFEFAETCFTPRDDADLDIYASQGDDGYSLEILWDKTAIDGPGTQTLDPFAGIFFYAKLGPELEPEIADFYSADGTVTFETYAPEDGVFFGTFDVTVDDPPFAATGAFDCM